MRAIVNSTPVISLSIIGKLDILKLIFSEVFVPQSVYNEIVVQGNGKWGSKELENANWINVENASNEIAMRTIMVDI